MAEELASRSIAGCDGDAARSKRVLGIGMQREATLWQLLTPMMADPLEHAEVLTRGRTAFRNALNATFADLRKMAKDYLRQSTSVEARMEAAQTMKFLRGYHGHEEVLEAAWDIFSREGWLETLTRVGRMAGCELPASTTPQMVLRHLDPPTTPDPVPEGLDQEVEIVSHLPEGEHEKVWEGSGRTRRGTMRDVLASSKLEEANQRLADGTAKIDRNHNPDGR